MGTYTREERRKLCPKCKTESKLQKYILTDKGLGQANDIGN